MGSVLDITEKKKLEEEVLRTKKLESIGVLAGGIAHDFNNILSGILGNISLARLYSDETSRSVELLLEAEKAVARARDLTQQLLTFSKGGVPVLRASSVMEVIRDSTNFVLRGSKVTCRFSAPLELWSVMIDPGQIGQVVHNLILNSEQAMPMGGAIEVTAENRSVAADSEQLLEPGNYVRITLRDEGTGIHPDHLAKVFDPFFTTKHKGSGLGLATAHSIIEKHHGHITVQSEMGSGTTFTIHLPASVEKVETTGQIEPVDLAGQGRILLMDDEQMIRDVAGMMLEKLGYEVEYSVDGAHALETYRTSTTPFDAVILDLTVPGGKGGRETISELLSLDPSARVIVSSGYSNDPTLADYEQLGFAGVIVKPYDIEELGKILQIVLAR
jgi:CheY-like chemotaxis protein